MLLHPLFASLPEEHKRIISQRMRMVPLKRGDVLATAGESSYDAFIVVNGRLRVDRGDAQGPQTTTGFLNANDIYLDNILATSYVLQHTLVAVLNSTVQAIPLVTLIGVSRKHPSMILQAVDLVHRRAQDLRRQVRRINTQESEVVIGRALYELADQAPDGRRVLSKRVTQAELASYVGMSREQVNKKMRELEAKGLIRRTEDGYELDPAFSQTNILAERT